MMKRALPTISIEGTTFQVDVEANEIRELADPENRISIFEMRDTETGYEFDYDRVLKNIPVFNSKTENIVPTGIPQLIELDPEGMAKKYGLETWQLGGKTDFEIMVDQEALAERLSGRLTTIDIAGHIFYVDIPMGSFRPKDDFSTEGILFNDLEDFISEDEQKYLFPYNPRTHELEQLDYDNITSVPEGIIPVEIPCEEILDPVGYARKHGFSLRDSLREHSIRSHFTAKEKDWKETGLYEIINDNIQKKLNASKSSAESVHENNKGKRIK